MAETFAERLLNELEEEYERIHTPDTQQDLSDAEVEFALKLYSVFRLLLTNARIGVASRKEEP